MVKNINTGMAQIAVVASYNERTKKILVLKEELNISTLYNVVSVKFGFTIDLNNYFLQYHDTDINEWIDLEEESIDFLKDFKFIKIKVCEQGKNEDTNGTENPVILDISVPSPTPSTPKNKGYTPNPSNPSTPSTPLTPLTPSTSGMPGRISSPTVTFAEASEKKKRKHWPKLYSVPYSSLSRNLQYNLDSKLSLDRKNRKMLLEAIYQDVTSHEGGLYPSPSMYDDVVDGLLREYPHLAAQTGLSSSSVRVYWKDKITTKFGNSRRRIDDNLPEVQARKRKKTDQTSSCTSIPVKSSLMWGLAKYLPERPQSEDDHSIQMHKEWMINESKKLNFNFESLQHRLNATFADRRKLIISERASIKEIIEQYPALTLHNQLLLEFERLEPNVPTKELETLFLQGLDNYMESIIGLVQTKKKQKLLSEILDTITCLRMEEQRKYATRCAAIMAVPTLFKEKIDDILEKSDQPSETESDSGVKLVLKKDILTTEDLAFVLEIESQTIAYCDNFLSLFITYIGAVYTFNLVYPKKIEKTMLFFQKVIMGLVDGDTCLDRKLLNVLAELKNKKKN